MTIDGLIPSGSSRYFEYHCKESHDSNDAQLWYRSHQQVVVGECVNTEDYGDLPRDERSECGHPLVYEITFADGFEGHAFEDELLESPEDYERPDPPPAPSSKEDATLQGRTTRKARKSWDPLRDETKDWIWLRVGGELYPQAADVFTDTEMRIRDVLYGVLPVLTTQLQGREELR